MQILHVGHETQSPVEACPDIAHLKSEPAGKGCLIPHAPEAHKLGSWGLVGLNHRTAPMDLRSRVALQGEQRRNFLRRAIESGLDECVVLSTCNRTEIYYAGGSFHALRHALSAASGVPVEELQPHLYSSAGICGACHLVRVAAGLDSAVLGETEIVSQVKEAWQAARTEEATGPMLDLLFRKALEASKRIRSQTELCRSATSLAFLAVRKAQQVAGELARRRVLVVGAGQIAERALKELVAVGVGKVVLANRTVENAQRLASSLGLVAEVHDLSDLRALLAAADAAFFCVTTHDPLLEAEELAAGPRVVVDFGVPPNVAGGEAPSGVTLLNVDHLREESESNAVRKQEALDPALGIVEEELKRFSAKLIERSAAPMIRALVRHAEDVRDLNLAWARERLSHLSDRDLMVVEQLAAKMAQGMLEKPIEHLKSEPPDDNEKSLVRRLFGLEDGAAK